MRITALALAAALAACGGGGDNHFDGDAVIDDHGTMVMPTDGAAILANGQGMIVVFGTASVSCDNTIDDLPSSGTYAILHLQAISGAYPNASIEIVTGGDSEPLTGMVTLSAASADTVAGSVTATDADLGVNGAFTVESCI